MESSGGAGHHGTASDRIGVMRSPSITPLGRAIWSLFLGALLASPTLGEETAPLPSGTNGDSEIEPDAVTLELYSPPHSLSRVVPKYPRLRAGEEP